MSIDAVQGVGYAVPRMAAGSQEQSVAAAAPAENGAAAGGSRVFSTAPTSATPALESSQAVTEASQAAPVSRTEFAGQVDALAAGLEVEAGRLRQAEATEAGRGGLQTLLEDGQDAEALGNAATEMREVATGLDRQPPVAAGAKMLDAEMFPGAADAEPTTTSVESNREAIAEAENQMAILDKLMASNPNPTAVTSGAMQVAETLQKAFGQTGLG
jgi:hypothetical protein